MYHSYRRIASVVIFGFFIFPSFLFAAEISVNINIYNNESALIDVSYPVTDAKDKVWAVTSSQGDGSSIYDYGRTFLLAEAKDGAERVLAGKEGDYVRPVTFSKTDKMVTLHYKVNDFFDNEDISLFNFPLLLNESYDSAKVNVITAPNITLLSSPGDDARNKGKIDSFTLRPDYKIKGQLYKFITLFTHSKSRSNDYTYLQKGRYLSVEPKSYSFNKKLSTTLSEMSFVDKMFNDIFAQKLPEKVTIAVVPLSKVPGYNYPVSGLTVKSNLILLAEDQFFGYRNDLENKLTITHELTHALQLAHLFKGEESYAIKGWMSEGMAVFAEQYTLDNYMRNIFSEKEIHDLDDRFHKLTRSEVSEMYKVPFDQDFDIDTEDQPIGLTYRHAGLIFAHLQLQDKTIIKKFFADLKNTVPSFCDECSLITTRKKLEKIANMSNNKIMYPLRTTILIPDKKTDVLFEKE